MQKIFDIVDSWFIAMAPVTDFLWSFPTNFEWYANIPVIGNFPFAIVLLVGMGIYFTVRTRGVQFRFFKAGIKSLTKKKKGDVGVSPLASFLLSTAMRVGPGNLTGVTGAVAVGGPGAIFWSYACSGIYCLRDVKYSDSDVPCIYGNRKSSGNADRS